MKLIIFRLFGKIEANLKIRVSLEQTAIRFKPGGKTYSSRMP
jgi:hypothetical protein